MLQLLVHPDLPSLYPLIANITLVSPVDVTSLQDRGAGQKIKKRKSESTGRTKKFGASDGNTKSTRTFKPKRSVASAYGSSRKPTKGKRSKTAFAKSKPKVEGGEELPTSPANSNALPALYQTSS